MNETLKISGRRIALPIDPASDPAKNVRVESRPGGWLVATLPSGERRRFQVHEWRGKLSMNLGGSLFQGDLSSDRAKSAGGAGGLDESALIAQFPGKVRKLLVAEGDVVEAGAALVLVEAMKMEFSIQAPYAGKVAKILVKEGQPLSPGDRFVQLEALRKAP